MSGSAQTAVRRIEGDHNELRFEVEIAGGRREIWFRTEAPITARADPAVAAVLLPAMRAGSPLRFDDPIDPLLIRRVPDLIELLASWRWLWKHLGYGVPQRIEVEAPAAGAVARAGGAEAAFFSGGVDSFFTVLEVPEVSRLIYVTGLDTRVDDPGAPAIRAAVGEAAERLGKPLITVETNIRELADEFVSYLSYFGSGLAAVAMLLEPEIARVQIASSSTYGAMVPNGSHPLLDSLWRSSAVEIMNHGSWITRADKLERIAGNEVAQSSLRVCWENPEAALNCGRCEKCLRTMVVLELLGVLERFATFPDELDLDAVAGMELIVPTSGEGWRAVLALGERHGARPELVAAIEACLRTERPWMPRIGGDPFDALERAEAEIAEIGARLERSEAILRERDATLRVQEAAMRDLLESGSWRMTAPLRRAKRALARRS